MPNYVTITSPSTQQVIDLSQPLTVKWQCVGAPGAAVIIKWRIVGQTATYTVATTSTTTTTYTFPATTFATPTHTYTITILFTTGTGGWGDNVFVVAVNKPATPTITTPATAATVPQNVTVTWAQVTAQTALQVRRVADQTGTPDTSTVYHDSGQVTSATPSYGVTFPTNNRTEHVQVRIMAHGPNGVWSTWADVKVNVHYVRPPAPTVTVTADDATASISVSWTHATPTGTEPAVSSARVYRSAATESELRIGKTLAPAGTFTDYLPASGVDYTYRVELVGSNGATSTASAS